MVQHICRLSECLINYALRRLHDQPDEQKSPFSTWEKRFTSIRNKKGPK
jgi:hypothetical protein